MAETKNEKHTWGEANFSAAPLEKLGDILNIFNQRLDAIEGMITVEENGKKITLRDYYKEHMIDANAEEKEEQEKENK